MAKDVVDEPSEDLVESAKKAKAASSNPFARIALFIRQVFGELKKVITPTRGELVKFTLVVLAFVVVMVFIVLGLDTVFGYLALLVFGNGS